MCEDDELINRFTSGTEGYVLILLRSLSFWVSAWIPDLMGNKPELGVDTGARVGAGAGAGGLITA